jgi:hypothetical protein
MKERSLIVIKGGSLDLIPDVVRFISDWCEERGIEAFMRNVPDGYEIVAKPVQNAPEVAK